MFVTWLSIDVGCVRCFHCLLLHHFCTVLATSVPQKTKKIKYTDSPWIRTRSSHRHGGVSGCASQYTLLSKLARKGAMIVATYFNDNINNTFIRLKVDEPCMWIGLNICCASNAFRLENLVPSKYAPWDIIC